MSAKDFQERANDSASRRRNLLDTEGKKAYDQFYGSIGAIGSKSRNRGGAGKGDAARPCNQLAYEIGMALTDESLSPEDRLELERLWYEVRGQVHPDDR